MRLARLLKTLIKTALIAFTGVGASFLAIFVFFIFFAAVASGLTSVSEEGVGAPRLELEYAVGDTDAETVFLSIPITGLILGDPVAEGEFTQFFVDSNLTYGYEVKEQLALAAEREDIAGVILEINSPGGTIYGSKAIADGVQAYQEATNKPVLAFVSGVAASGGYWAAASAEEVIADTGTATGSIGVIAGPYKYYSDVVSEDGGAFVGGVVTAGGIETTYITAGESKDLGNPYRQLSPEELATLQEMANLSYSEFVQFVAQQRNLENGVIREQVKALIYGEQQAIRLGLIDSVGSKQNAYDRLAELASVDRTEYQIKRAVGESDFFSSFLGVIQQWGKQGQVSQPSLQGCPLSSVVLAYHGEVTSLCR